jgi:chromosome segregation ATPase
MEAFSTASRRSPTRGRQSPTKSATESNLLSYIQNQRSPAKPCFVPSTPAEKRHLLNLLDFELPPPPTPRSVPSITIRELESLKSNYQSQVSSLTASLSGKEAEVSSLKKAVSNAERRVGEAQEDLRNERSAREHAEKQKAEWEKKGTEVEAVLKSIKEEVMKSDQEREDLLHKLDEAERRAEDAEARVNDAESRAIEAEGKCVDTTMFVEADTDKPSKGPLYTAEEVQKQIDEKVQTLCKELHVIYKRKHEGKVSALKRSYESKMDKRTKELHLNVKTLNKKVEELQHARDATFSTVLPTELPSNSSAATNAADLKKLETQQAEIEEQKARLAGLESEIKSVRDNHTQALKELEAERVEKGELVAAAEQMLALQMEFQAQAAAQEELRRSVGPVAGSAVRPSGLTRPGFAGSGIGSRSTSGKSRIMSNIEKMGGRAPSVE